VQHIVKHLWSSHFLLIYADPISKANEHIVQPIVLQLRAPQRRKCVCISP